MKGWVEDIKILASIAKDYPKSAYAAMVFSIQHRWRYIQQTVPNISDLFKDLENEIYHTLLPAILGRKFLQKKGISLHYLSDMEVWGYQSQKNGQTLNLKHLKK